MLARNFRHKRFPPSSHILLSGLPAEAHFWAQAGTPIYSVPPCTNSSLSQWWCTIINSNDYGKHKWKKIV